MCDKLKIENSVTIELTMVAGQSRYLLSNFRRLDGRFITGCFITDPTDAASNSSPEGKDLASLATVEASYLSLQTPEQVLRLDTFPCRDIVRNQAHPITYELNPMVLDTDKSFLSVNTTSATTDAGKSILLVLLYNDVNA